MQRVGDDKWRVGVAEMQGYRTSMEDAHQVLLSLPSHPHLTFVGVYDGHNGSAAAEWMAANMGSRLSKLDDPTDPVQLREAIEQADADFCSNEQLRAHGSTACIALINNQGQKKTLTVANVGDSRCLVIGRDGNVKFTTIDHKPEDAAELARIYAAGGSVSFGRVDGDLAMSRSIGDYAYKSVAHRGQLEQRVIPSPDVSVVELDPTDIILVCCDGLLEKLTNEQLADFLTDRLNEAMMKAHGEGENSQSSRSKSKSSNGTNGKTDDGDKSETQDHGVDPAEIVASLIDHSLHRGSKDNMSAALLLPMDGSAYTRADEYILGPYLLWQNNNTFANAYLSDARKHGLDEEEVLRRLRSGEGTMKTNAEPRNTDDGDEDDDDDDDDEGMSEAEAQAAADNIKILLGSGFGAGLGSGS